MIEPGQLWVTDWNSIYTVISVVGDDITVAAVPAVNRVMRIRHIEPIDLYHNATMIWPEERRSAA